MVFTLTLALIHAASSPWALKPPPGSFPFVFYSCPVLALCSIPQSTRLLILVRNSILSALDIDLADLITQLTPALCCFCTMAFAWPGPGPQILALPPWPGLLLSPGRKGSDYGNWSKNWFCCCWSERAYWIPWLAPSLSNPWEYLRKYPYLEVLFSVLGEVSYPRGTEIREEHRI